MKQIINDENYGNICYVPPLTKTGCYDSIPLKGDKLLKKA